MEPNMEGDRRVILIYVAVALLLMFCCCAMITAAAAGSWLASWPSGRSFEQCCDGSSGLDQGQERLDRTYRVGTRPRLFVDNVAGSINVRDGERGEVRVIAIKQGVSSRDLVRITIEIDVFGGELTVDANTLPAGNGYFEVLFSR